jgi:hypothetical protein
MINFGGNQRDNYSSGIQIPVYVPALGLAGGYLRYLYDTYRRREEILQALDDIKEEVYDPDYRFYPDPKGPSFWQAKGVDKSFSQAKTPEEKEFESQMKERKEIGSRVRHYYLFEILKRVGLLLLSPLLAAAVWLFLTQVGFQSQAQTSLYVLGAVSFTIGLITEEAVGYVTRAVSKLLGLGEPYKSPPRSPPKSGGAGIK